MSRAFTSEEQNEAGLSDIGERPASTNRNLVTEHGLALIDGELEKLRAELARAEAGAERERIALLSRDLRYWLARRETAELSVPEADSDVVRFGMTVTIEDDGGRRKDWHIVGEDEADAGAGSISHVSPMAVALFGRKVGDVATVNGKAWEIVALRS